MGNRRKQVGYNIIYLNRHIYYDGFFYSTYLLLINNQTEILSKLMEIMDRNTKAIEKLTSNSNQNSRPRKRTCYACGEENHMARECPNKTSENPTGSQ